MLIISLVNNIKKEATTKLSNNGIKLLATFLLARRHLDLATHLDNLSQGEFLVLRRIRVEHDENEARNITMFKAVRISQYLSMPAPAISRILNSLEEKQLITRATNTKNRRAIIITLTSKGKTTLANAEAKINAFAENLSRELGDINTLNLINSLEKVTKFCKKLKTDVTISE